MKCVFCTKSFWREDLVRVVDEVLNDDVVEFHLGDERLWSPGLGHAVHQVGAEHDGKVVGAHLVGRLVGNSAEMQDKISGGRGILLVNCR